MLLKGRNLLKAIPAMTVVPVRRSRGENDTADTRQRGFDSADRSVQSASEEEVSVSFHFHAYWPGQWFVSKKSHFEQEDITMAATKKMTDAIPAPVALMGIASPELMDEEMKISACGKKSRGNGKALSKDACSTIYQSHQCDMAVPEVDPKIVLL
jgi:hypothetical protein